MNNNNIHIYACIRHTSLNELERPTWIRTLASVRLHVALHLHKSCVCSQLRGEKNNTHSLHILYVGYTLFSTGLVDKTLYRAFSDRFYIMKGITSLNV